MRRPTTPRRQRGGLRLTRKAGETLVIFLDGKRVEVVVSSLDPGAVRLRIVAPPEVEVWRGELPQARGLG